MQASGDSVHCHAEKSGDSNGALGRSGSWQFICSRRGRLPWPVSRAYHARVIEGSRSPIHAGHWIASLENNIPKDLWHKPIADVTAPELLSALIDLQARIPETATRIRQRLDAVFEDAVFHQLASSNPAATIRRKLRETQGRRVRNKLRALPSGDGRSYWLGAR